MGEKAASASVHIELKAEATSGLQQIPERGGERKASGTGSGRREKLLGDDLESFPARVGVYNPKGARKARDASHSPLVSTRLETGEHNPQA